MGPLLMGLLPHWVVYVSVGIAVLAALRRSLTIPFYQAIAVFSGDTGRQERALEVLRLEVLRRARRDAPEVASYLGKTSPEDLLDSPEDLLDSPEDLLDSPEDLLDSPEDLLDSLEAADGDQSRSASPASDTQTGTQTTRRWTNAVNRPARHSPGGRRSRTA